MLLVSKPHLLITRNNGLFWHRVCIVSFKYYGITMRQQNTSIKAGGIQFDTGPPRSTTVIHLLGARSSLSSWKVIQLIKKFTTFINPEDSSSPATGHIPEPFQTNSPQHNYFPKTHYNVIPHRYAFASQVSSSLQVYQSKFRIQFLFSYRIVLITQTMLDEVYKLLITQFSPLLFFPLRSECSHWRIILEHSSLQRQTKFHIHFNKL